MPISYWVWRCPVEDCGASTKYHAVCHSDARVYGLRHLKHIHGITDTEPILERVVS